MSTLDIPKSWEVALAEVNEKAGPLSEETNASLTRIAYNFKQRNK